MSGFASNTPDHTQPPQRPDVYRDENENPHTVSDQPTFASTEKSAECDESAAGEDND